MATLIRQGVELGELEEFETWVESAPSGDWLRRCLFALPPPLAKVDPTQEGLAVRLKDGTVWDLRVLRSTSAEARVYVTSALLSASQRPAIS
jgi:hypothetical protein